MVGVAEAVFDCTSVCGGEDEDGGLVGVVGGGLGFPMANGLGRNEVAVGGLARDGLFGGVLGERGEVEGGEGGADGGRDEGGSS